MQLLRKSRFPLRFSARPWMRDPALALLRNGGLAKAACLIALAAAAPSCSDDVTGFRSSIVSGTVRVRNGAPLAGATVGFFEHVTSAAVPARMPARAPAKDPGPTVVVTDAGGRYAIALSGGHYDVWIGGVADSGIMPVQVTDVVVNASRVSVVVNASRVSLDLSYPGYHVTGRMSHLGVWLASGSVFVQGSTNTALAELRNGAYSLLLPAGTYDVWANPNEGYWGVPRVKHEGIIVSADTTIDLAVDGHFVEGTVTGPGGSIQYGAVVSATAPGASAWNYTDSNGRYGLHLPDGEYAFLVTPPPGGDTLGALHTLGVIITAPRTLDFQLLPKPAPPGG
jgi:hypothetical protein